MKRTKEPTYSQDAQKALENHVLQSSLKKLQNRFGKGVMEYWAAKDDDELRDRVKRRRMSTIENLDVVLSLLADNVQKAGGHVYFAKTGSDAVKYCLRVAQKNEVKTVVKGKSMLSAEIGVDKALEQQGVEVVETDLGEFIIQLAGDAPSHIIAPCIHLNRQQIGKLFQEKLGIDYTDDPPELTRAARGALRRKMIDADMGITGCNFACAETGKISLVSNEGNIRMATTMPRIHLALMGIERIAATMQEHQGMLQLLTRGAALQKLSTYVSFVGGPKSEGDPDGPEEFHLVLVDNGRSKILGDPEFREVLACLRCGACLNICPVYGRIGGHAYHSPYPGPIGAVVSPLLFGMNQHADLCKGESLCGACLDICPVKIDLPRMLLALRHKLAYGDAKWQARQHKPSEAFAFKLYRLIISNSMFYRLALRCARLLQKPFMGKSGMIGKMMGPGARWTNDRDLPPLAREPFNRRWKKKHSRNQKRNNEVNHG
ncbi:LutB/LldF family L-lactate oxidation iron-sulfur protein [Desulfopila inferna]|uniref:LutB/LldF family L-lactate oxidation iron-sulfur protein n=1 Tax=Desulfopila inferna TaxID=468528 RepID=UPI00196592CF|nr:LutB/LldF family L-lactate oxidation iron-sulfur protein [Desulfopila inferna]MBM9603780.1 iron-sulfur cluster-binding protein [Desulfopila inferna]